MQYALFKTRWGWFGLAGDADGLRRACLPLPDKVAVKAYLLTDAKAAVGAADFADCRQQVQAYFEGERVDFSSVPVNLSGFGTFAQAVLKTLHRLPYGRTLTYSELAAHAGRPRAVRAAASAVAANPLPLIVPCHRILRKDGSLGGFSAPGGVVTKQRLLDLESGRLQ